MEASEVRTLAVAAAIWVGMLSANEVAAQPGGEESAVLATVDTFFTALGAADREGLERTTMPGSQFLASYTSESGTPVLDVMSRDEIVARFSNPPAKYLERYWSPTVLVRGDIATFWAFYDFHVDGAFSHCGIDSFQMFKVDGRWVIGNSSFTREKTDCPENPQGPVSGQ